MSGRYDVEKSRAADGAPLVGAPLLALERPGRVALRVQVVAIESRRRAVPIEFDLELHLSVLHRLAADRAGRAVSRPAERTVGGPGRKDAAANRVARSLGEDRIVRHGNLSVWLWRCGEIVPQRAIDFRNV